MLPEMKMLILDAHIVRIVQMHNPACSACRIELTQVAQVDHNVWCVYDCRYIS